MIHHGNQKVKQDGYIDDAVTAKHGHSPETGVTLNSFVSCVMLSCGNVHTIIPESIIGERKG